MSSTEEIEQNRETVRKLLPQLESLNSDPSVVATEVFHQCARFVPPEEAGALAGVLLRHIASFAEAKKQPGHTQRHDLNDAFAKSLRHLYEHATAPNQFSSGTGDTALAELHVFAQDIQKNLSSRTWVYREITSSIGRIEEKIVNLNSLRNPPPAVEKPPVQIAAAAAQVTEPSPPVTIVDAITQVGQIFRNLSAQLAKSSGEGLSRVAKGLSRGFRNAAFGAETPSRDKITKDAGQNSEDPNPKP